MHMLVLAVELDQFSFKVGANTSEDLAQVIQNLIREHAAAVFCHEDQVYMHQENAVSAFANVVVGSHRPNYDWHHEAPASLRI